MNGISEHPMVLCCGLVGLIFAIAGAILWIFPPKKINGLYGYRTAKSMSSEESWKFAQTYSAKLMTIGGFGMMLLTPLALVIPEKNVMSVGLSIAPILIVTILLFVKTESKLKSKFPSND